MSEPTYYVSIERPHNRLYVNAFDVSEEIAKALLWEGVRKGSDDLAAGESWSLRIIVREQDR